MYNINFLLLFLMEIHPGPQTNKQSHFFNFNPIATRSRCIYRLIYLLLRYLNY